MEPSKLFGCKEECSSSVSGWTMYLGSPRNEDDNYDDDDDDDDDDDRNTYQQGDTFKRDYHLHDDDDANDKSDDSMASDASSGPRHQELPIPGGNSKPSLDKHATSKYSWKQNLQKQKTKRDESRIKVERDEQPVLITKSTASQALSGAKARKSKQMGK